MKEYLYNDILLYEVDYLKGEINKQLIYYLKENI